MTPETFNLHNQLFSVHPTYNKRYGGKRILGIIWKTIQVKILKISHPSSYIYRYLETTPETFNLHHPFFSAYSKVGMEGKEW